MSVLKTLRERIAPELNHLYTSPPSEVAGALDCGWHGREHALHTWFVARMFGANADLCVGDYAVLSRFLPPLTTLEKELDHAWCTVNGVAPVDLSMTFALYGNSPQLHAAIIGEGRNGDWDIQYAEDESPMDESFSNRNEIIFVENEIIDLTADTLLENPLAFIKPPVAGSPETWQSHHGPDIYAKITLHCFKVATGDATNVRHRLNRDEAITWIAENYPNAANEISQHLRSAPAEQGGAA